jgi:hypothetical protein
MTFTEAALEVLRSAGEPLHYKKITELAIERNLLSHVGKTPEVTMSSRLAMMVKKDRGQAPIIKVKPGVFAIRESALQGQDLSPAALAAISEVEGLEDGSASDNGLGTDEPKPPAPLLPGGDVFPEEEGDDDPILAGLEQESESVDRTGRRRRRRRRRGKGDKVDGPADVTIRPEPVREREPVRVREPIRAREPVRDSGRERNQGRERDSARERDAGPGRGRERDAYREPARDSGRDVGRDAGRDSGRDRSRGDEAVSLDWNRQPADGDLLGKDLADAVWAVMSRGDRVPHTFARVAELLVRRGRLSGNPAALAPTIAAAARADVSRAQLTRARPRFALRGGRVMLSEWLLPRPLARVEQDLLSSAERYTNELRRTLIQKLSELPTAGFAELVATWLNAEGITALRAVRRPGSSGSELHFAGTRKSGSEEVRLAIVVQRAGRDIDREAVIDVRGALHHYGQATSAWIVTTGRVTSGAREEASMQAASCALFDGMALASAMERLGIAVQRHVIAHHELDYDLLEALGDTPEQRERREREQERERREFANRSEGRPGGGGPRVHDVNDVQDEPSAARSARGAAESGQDEDDDAEERAQTLVPAKPLTDSDWDEEPEEDAEAQGDLDQADDADDAVDDELAGDDDDVEPFTDELDDGEGDDAAGSASDDDSSSGEGDEDDEDSDAESNEDVGTEGGTSDRQSEGSAEEFDRASEDADNEIDKEPGRARS